MPFIPHTTEDIQAMLQVLGENDLETLFDEIPAALRISGLPDIPEGVSEYAIDREVNERLAIDRQDILCFIGAGAYEHHIPAAVWDIAGRGEFLTAYTPYQAEASQGTLQLIYEYQTMLAKLTGMAVANASLYDGATALAEAILMACRLSKGHQHKILLPSTVHPNYRRTVATVVNGMELCELPYQHEIGGIDVNALDQHADAAVLVIQHPNFFGTLEDVDALTDWAHAHNMLVIAVVNPTSLALLKEPGQWGAQGADIVCGEGQPLGVPLSGGGPYFGFLTSRQKFVRQIPGRIVGRTLDGQGRVGFTLTLQAREQHIRRGKATSNICTNQGLLVTAATIYLSLLGPEGLTRVAYASHQNTQHLLQQLTTIPGVKRVFSGDVFHEGVIQLNQPVDQVVIALAKQGIHGGYALGTDYPELDNCLLVCATETKNQADLTRYQHVLTQVLEAL